MHVDLVRALKTWRVISTFNKSYKETIKAATVTMGYIGTNKLLRTQPLSSGQRGKE